jgi:hypothetical protein
MEGMNQREGPDDLMNDGHPCDSINQLNNQRDFKNFSKRGDDSSDKTISAVEEEQNNYLVPESDQYTTT